MKKRLLAVLLGLFTIFALTGCMQKTKEDVVKDLDAKVKSMKSYQAEAKLSIKTGAEKQEYDVDIWHNKPNFYRVSLNNAKKEQNQIILRNADGVFVLTPALNKSFRFQSEWPQNSSQSYLYESLVRDVVKDKNATFKQKGDFYVFETKTNYQNHTMIPKQEITFNKKDLAPVGVKLMDSDSNVLVEVKFTKMKFDAKFDNGAFDMKKNMSGAQMEVPTIAKEDQPFAVLHPTELKGLKQKEEKEMQLANGKRIITTYGDSKKSFTLIQEKAKVASTSDAILVSGEPVDLGFTVGILTENTIVWTHKGVEYTLAAKGMKQDEILSVASSVYEKASK